MAVLSSTISGYFVVVNPVGEGGREGGGSGGEGRGDGAPFPAAAKLSREDLEYLAVGGRGIGKGLALFSVTAALF